MENKTVPSFSSPFADIVIVNPKVFSALNAEASAAALTLHKSLRDYASDKDIVAIGFALGYLTCKLTKINELIKSIKDSQPSFKDLALDSKKENPPSHPSDCSIA